ncbi:MULTISPECIES: recombinase family protein [Streptomyces]|uniref:recombinase family protein n=1 Tax=Streptomyces TaxID=1883 RepID=UPI001D0403C7|nr:MULTISPECIES: recombinase family protein [Streptomyces]
MHGAKFRAHDGPSAAFPNRPVGRRRPGRPWRPGTPPPAPIDPDLPSADIRIGSARCSTLGQELDSQLDALAAHGIPRGKIFSEKISTRSRVRPKFEEALRTAREAKAHRCTDVPQGRDRLMPLATSWPERNGRPRVPRRRAESAAREPAATRLPAHGRPVGRSAGQPRGRRRCAGVNRPVSAVSWVNDGCAGSTQPGTNANRPPGTPGQDARRQAEPAARNARSGRPAATHQPPAGTVPAQPASGSAGRRREAAAR